MIALEHVSKRFGPKVAVEDLSFAVARGELVGFLGPNGAGKTTTLRMIAGYLTPSSGTVTVGGHDMATRRVEGARRLGYLPERPPLYDILEVREYLGFIAKAKGLSRSIGPELARVCESCRLEAVFRVPIYKLSKGYRQRVGLAQALLGRPDVLVLDEPTLGLDPRQIQETREVIRSFAEAHAVLLSTHILGEATLLCDRIAILSAGRLLAIDSPQGLERAVSEGNRVVVEVRAPEAEVRARLREVPGVRAVAEATPLDSGGLLRLACDVEPGGGAEAAIARALAARWDLQRLEREHPSLERVFLRYVGDGGDARSREVG